MPTISQIRCEVYDDSLKEWFDKAICISSEPNVLLAVLEKFELRVLKGQAKCWFRPNAIDEMQPEFEIAYTQRGPSIRVVQDDGSGYLPIREIMTNGV